MVCALVVGLVLVPDTALAWGPISHLAHGSEVLRELTILGPSLQQLLTRYPTEYLYGCVGADITLGKKYTHAMQAHCHSWEVGWQVVAAAESDAQRAFAYGYLSHLAADVYSHNHFVPTQLVVSFRARTLRHVYWEARFDSMQDPDYRGIVSDLRRQCFPECDRAGEESRGAHHLLLPHQQAHLRLGARLPRLGQWHRFMQHVSTRSRHHLPEPVVRRYNRAVHRNIVDLLQRGKRSDCQSADPTGPEALTLAKDVRRSLKALVRRRGDHAGDRSRARRSSTGAAIWRTSFRAGPPGAPA